MTIEREINKLVNIRVNFLHQCIEDILIRIFIFATNDVVVVIIYNCLHLLVISHSLCSWQVLPQLVVVFAWWSDPDLYSLKVWIISSPACIVSTDFNHSTIHGNAKWHPRGTPAYFALASLMYLQPTFPLVRSLTLVSFVTLFFVDLLA